jgi:starch-binding outer membrane protein, SusD/RagB family
MYNMKNAILKYTAMTGLVLASFGCSEEFLDKTPQSQITLDNFYQTKEQVYASTASLYSKPWFNYHYLANHYVEAMAGNTIHPNNGAILQYALFNVQGNEQELNLMWGSFFRVVGFANSIIKNLPIKVGSSVSADDVKHAMAEARFMRAAAYFYLVRLYGAVPIVEDPETLVAGDSNIPRNTVETVYEFIIRDLKFAEQNGFTTKNNEGRVSMWAAKAMLAKVYLQQKDYANAKIKTEEVINSGQYALYTDYFDNFRTVLDNGKESIFALQWHGTDHWTAQNTLQAWLAPSGDISEVGDGWGLFLPTIDLVNRFEAGDKRKRWTVMTPGETYTELVSTANPKGYTYPANRQVSTTGANWRKGIVGSPAKNGGTDGFVDFMRTALNTNVIRYADVLLMNAEATLGTGASTSDAKALANFNEVRKRAGLSQKASITLDDIMQERRVEFAGEFDFWYDLLRMPRAKAATYIADQERGTVNAGVVNSRKAVAADIDWTLPIPVGELDRAPRLKDEPVPYQFK